MPSIVNQLALAEMKASLEDADSLVLLVIDGVSMPENESLRSSLAEGGVSLRIVSNKLAKLALKEKGLDFPDETFKGPLAIAAGNAEQAIHAAKVATSKDVKKLGKVTIRGGALEGEVLGASDALALADIPDQDTVRSKILGCLSGPAQQLVGLLNANQGALARVLQAKIDADGGAPTEG